MGLGRAVPQELDPIVRVASALVRAIRAMGYYDVGHPVFQASEREAHQRVLEALGHLPLLTIGSAGSHLVVDEEGAVSDDEPSRALAYRMFKLCIVAIRFFADVRPSDLGGLA